MQDFKRLGDIIKRDPFRMRCLRALRALDLPQGYIGAGFVRNAIWDELHARATPTPLNDIDVIYFSGGINRRKVLRVPIIHWNQYLNRKLTHQILQLLNQG